MSLFLIMFILHCIDDFCLQTHWLSNGKQKLWWEKVAPDEKYKYDYIIALLIHAFEWSAMISIPLIFMGLSPILLGIIFIVNGLIHAYVDDLKANKHKLNLIQDQLIHIVQLIITCVITYIIT